MAQSVSAGALIRIRVEPNPKRQQKDREAEDGGGNKELAHSEVEKREQSAEHCGR